MENGVADNSENVATKDGEGKEKAVFEVHGVPRLYTGEVGNMM